MIFVLKESKCLFRLFQKHIRLDFLEDFNGPGDAFSGLLLSPFCFVEESQTEMSLGQNSPGADFTGEFNRSVEVFFRLLGRTGNEFDEGVDVLYHEGEVLGFATLNNLKV